MEGNSILRNGRYFKIPVQNRFARLELRSEQIRAVKKIILFRRVGSYTGQQVGNGKDMVVRDSHLSSMLREISAHFGLCRHAQRKTDSDTADLHRIYSTPAQPSSLPLAPSCKPSFLNNENDQAREQ